MWLWKCLSPKESNVTKGEYAQNDVVSLNVMILGFEFPLPSLSSSCFWKNATLVNERQKSCDTRTINQAWLKSLHP
jgi:hypothetical protein